MIFVCGWIVGSSSDLDWGDVEDYGADSDVERYLANRDGACDFGERSATHPKSRHINFLPMRTSKDNKKEGARALLKNLATKCKEASRKLAP